MFLYGSIARVFEVVGAFLWREGVEERTGTFPCRFEASFAGRAHHVLKFGEDLLDRIEVGAIGGQEDETRAGVADRLSYGSAFMAAEIVENDDIAFFQSRHEHVGDVTTERFAVDRAVQDEGSIDPVVAKRGEEGHGLPMAMRDKGTKTFALLSPAAQGRHVRLDPCLIDEYETARIDAGLPPFPEPSPPGNISAALLAGKHGFF